jgi:hypothetical protein
MSAGPSTEIPPKSPSDVEAMVVDPPLVAASTGRAFTNDALSSIVVNVRKMQLIAKSCGMWQDDGTYTALDGILPWISRDGLTFNDVAGSCPESLLGIIEIQNNLNVAKKRDPDFIKLFRQALKENNEEFWGCVLTHGMLPDLRWTGLSTAHSQYRT